MGLPKSLRDFDHRCTVVPGRSQRDLRENSGWRPLPRSMASQNPRNRSISYGVTTSAFLRYNHWRPYTAIRWAENDGNPNTLAEETWTNTHRHTYAFPSYPSAHGTACAAAMTAFENVFGDEYAFTMRIPMVDIAGPFSGKIEMHPPTRDFESFSAAATQCGLSRVYLGIHFRYDSVEGVQLGKAVGRNVVDNYLGPTNRSD